MTEREYDALDTDARGRLLLGLTDTDHIGRHEPFMALPYWLRHHIAHHVVSASHRPLGTVAGTSSDNADEIARILRARS